MRDRGVTSDKDAPGHIPLTELDGLIVGAVLPEPVVLDTAGGCPPALGALRAMTNA